MAKPLEELTITDDFMFGAVMRDPEKCKPLLEMVLGIKINKIEYLEPQKSVAERYESKSIRLDVYVATMSGRSTTWKSRRSRRKACRSGHVTTRE